MPKLLTKQNFKCDMYCGECCKKLLVDVTKKEIDKIENLNYKKEDFVFLNPFKKSRFFLKKDEKGWCVFLKKDKEGKYSCNIYKDRPKTCKTYPFFKENKKIISCLPEKLYPSVFSSLKK
ncbi:YkgJ family cysteine cluster protein [Candidatus Woesearchaeota archaeon]|nr:YkgJ family cysteine cluster protein [Candidatus Woesearchaeota archaeon]